jgi:hypothetical protein
MCARPFLSGASTEICRSNRPGTQQGGVEDVGPVGRRDQDDVGLDVEAVHLDEQLVEGLLAFVVAAAHAGAAVPADGVDLVDEDDRGSVGLCLLEQVTHAAGTDADEHLDEVRARDGEEGHPSLAGYCAGEQGLAGARSAVQQDALGDLGADGLELGRLGQELLDLLQLFDGLLSAGDIGEGDLGRLLAHQLGLGLAEAHDPAAAALHLAHEEPEEPEDDDDGQDGDQQARDPALSRHLVVVGADLVLGPGGDHGLGNGQSHRVDVKGLHTVGVAHVPTAEGLTLLQVEVDALIPVDEGDLVDLALVDELEGHRGVDPLVALPDLADLDSEQPDHDNEQHPDRWAPQESPEVHGVGARAPSSC